MLFMAVVQERYFAYIAFNQVLSNVVETVKNVLVQELKLYKFSVNLL